MKSWNLFAAAALATSLAGCAGGANYSAGEPANPLSRAALADEVFLDGTAPASRRAAYSAPVRYQGDVPDGTPRQQAVARSRPLAIEREARSDVVSGTTGSARNQAPGDPNKPFSDAWRERERVEDARLKAQMDICRGC